MAFQNKNLAVLCYANGFTLWHYRTDDTMDEVSQPSYFSSIYGMVNVGDIMLLTCDDKSGFRMITDIISNKFVKLCELQ